MKINTNNIASLAMLVRLSFTFFAGAKTDKKQSAKIEEEEGISTGTAKVIKNLFARGDLAGLRAVNAKLGNQLNLLTLPWDDRGYRLLPAKAFTQFQKVVLELTEEHDLEVRKLQGMYPNILAEREWELKGLFDAADYPLVQDLPQRYKINVSYGAIPDTGNWKMDLLSHAQQTELKASVEATLGKQMGDAQKESVLRLIEAFSHLRERLDYTANEDKKIFRDTTVNRVSELLAVAQEMNFANDPEIDAAIAKAKERLCPQNITPDLVRHNPEARQVLCSRLEETVNEMTEQFGGLIS
tara:strand:+ start:385 stop:1278 length:894 start_codon:yes stop_codon:yes gene_type:complete